MTEAVEQSQIWRLEGSSAEAYERYLVPMMFAPWAEQLVESAAVRSGERVLDVACGTGIVARYAATRVGPRGSVVGLDLNEGMLRAAREATQGAGAGVMWTAASASEMPFEDREFDVVFCQQALQFFQDRQKAVQEMHRVLTPDGRLAISVWRPLEHNPGYVVLSRALENQAGADVAEIVRASFPPWGIDDVRSLFRDAGFNRITINIGIGSMRYPSAHEFLRREAASSTLGVPITALSADVREAVVREIDDGLESYQDDDGLVFPMETYLVLAHP